MFKNYIKELEEVKKEFRPQYDKKTGNDWKTSNHTIDNAFRKEWDKIRTRLASYLLECDKDTLGEINLWTKEQKSLERSKYRAAKSWADYSLDREVVLDIELELYNTYILRAENEPYFEELADCAEPVIKTLRQDRMDAMARKSHKVDINNCWATINKCNHLLELYEGKTEILDLPSRICETPAGMVRTAEAKKVYKVPAKEEPVKTGISFSVPCPHCHRQVSVGVN